MEKLCSNTPVGSGLVESKSDEDVSVAKSQQVFAVVHGGKKVFPVLTRQSGKLDSELFSYIAFVIVVFISFVAAVTVISHELPLLIGELVYEYAERLI